MTTLVWILALPLSCRKKAPTLPLPLAALSAKSNQIPGLISRMIVRPNCSVWSSWDNTHHSSVSPSKAERRWPWWPGHFLGWNSPDERVGGPPLKVQTLCCPFCLGTSSPPGLMVAPLRSTRSLAARGTGCETFPCFFIWKMELMLPRADVIKTGMVWTEPAHSLYTLIPPYTSAFWSGTKKEIRLVFCCNFSELQGH